ncbi:hypothetical protein Q4517_15360, partial [Tenacibaculum sp. 1_MG-2023]|uniref:hypothetical protein n=1 Tax=Tenacibaculum sp. 1_MG-2023 TaxID=3062653 RepID=UPI0026E235D5
PSFTAVAEASLCSGDDSGRITLTAVDNGILPLTYSIVPAAGTITGNVITDLPPGTYSVTGEGTNGCTFTVTDIVIDEYAPIVPSTPVVDQFGCSAGNTVDVATVTIPVGTIGGSTNYTRYVFVYTPADGSGPITQDGSSTSFSTTNTSGGPVQVTVYDDKGCSGVENTVIDSFTPMTGADINVIKDTDCNTGENITVKVVPALPNIQYTITGTGATPFTQTLNVVSDADAAVFNDVPVDNYTIEIYNAATGCILEVYHTVKPEPTFDILITNVDDVDCKGDTNGSAVLSFVPSTPPYTSGYSYIVYDATTGTATAVTGTGTAGTPETITGLVAGEYYVRIDMGTNSPFCEAQSANFTIAEPADPLSVTGVANPVVSCYNGSDATITATGSGGWGDYVYQLEETATPGVAYAGNTFSSNNIFTNLPAGDYTVVVRDKNGATGLYCESTDQVVIANPAAVTFTVTENDNSCDTTVGGSISVTATGGTGTYTYTLSNGSGVVETQILNAANYTFTNLAADAYTVNVVDSNGCTEGTPTAVTITPDLVFTLTETKKLTCTAPMAATVALEVTSGSSSYAYEVAGPSIAVGRTNLAGTTLTLNPTVAGTYTVTV